MKKDTIIVSGQVEGSEFLLDDYNWQTTHIEKYKEEGLRYIAVYETEPAAITAWVDIDHVLSAEEIVGEEGELPKGKLVIEGDIHTFEPCIKHKPVPRREYTNSVNLGIGLEIN